MLIRSHWQPTHIHILFRPQVGQMVSESFWQPTHIHILFQGSENKFINS